MRIRFLPAAIAALCLPALAATQDEPEVTVEITPLAGNVHLLTGQGGNLGVCVGEDGIFVIDDQFAPLTERILLAIGELSGDPVRFVVNTHWHGDHTGGNENMKGAGAVLVAHRNVRERMSTEQFQEIWDRTTPPSPPGALPVVTFTDEVGFHWNGELIRVMHVPHAHTDGDAVVLFSGSNVVHMGDVLFSGMYPFIDIDTGGSARGVIAACDRVLPLLDEETLVVAGHGPVCDRASLQAYRDMLATVVERMEAALAEGMSLAEVQEAGITAGFDEAWGGGWIDPSTFVEILYADLSRGDAH
jgi:cyclase